MESRPASSTTPSVTFVCCIEAGPLEAMALRLIRSLRESGGRFRDCPFFAVIPRTGPALARSTRRALSELAGSLVDVRSENRFPWTPYFGKALACVAADRSTTAECVCLLDTDIVITGEPNLLELDGPESFAGCLAFDAAVSSAGRGDANDHFWEAACAGLGLPLDALAWTTTSQSQERIRLHFNAGVLVFRRSSGFARAWLGNFNALLRSRIAHPVWGVHSVDEVTAAITVELLGLKWRPLPVSYNCSIPSWSAEGYRAARFRDAVLLHYHSGMTEGNWPSFIGCLRATHPETARWLAALGPVSGSTGPWSQVEIACLRTVRSLRRRWHIRRCRLPTMASSLPLERFPAVE
jgi:hypothetical protein